MKAKRLWSIVVLVSLLAIPTAARVGAAQTTSERAQTLKIAIGGPVTDPTNFNITDFGVDRSTGMHQLVYEYFFYVNLQTGEYIPWLAESYQYSPDYTSLTVKLRDGVTWNDGQPFTADDVVFTYDLMRANPTMAWAANANDNVKSVEKIDNLNVKFNLTKANPRFHLIREAFPAVGIWGGATILPKHIWEGKDPATFKNNPPVGTGPYKLKDATQNAVTWERRDDWWGTKAFGVTPAPKTVQFVNLGAESNVAFALSNNEIDTPSIGILSAGSFLQVAGRNPNVRAWLKDAPYAWSDPCPRALMIQNATPPLDKPEVRWALSYLIDRQKIVDLAYEDTTVPAWGIWPNYDANKPYFDAIADLRQEYPSDAYDPDKAAQLFSQAGVSPKDLKLRYVVDSSSNEEVKVSAVLADQLSAAGIDVQVQTMTGSVLDDTILRGDYDIKLHSFCPGYIVENLDLFHSKNYRPLGEKAPWYEQDSFRYKNPALDAIVDKMFQVPPDDTATLTGLYHDAMSIWLKDLPVVPVIQAPALVPFNSTYWTGWPTADDPWNMPVSWWATLNLVINGYKSPETGEWVGGLKPAK
jgi:peptide/nickel transport system substrate-binding protein